MPRIARWKDLKIYKFPGESYPSIDPMFTVEEIDEDLIAKHLPVATCTYIRSDPESSGIWAHNKWNYTQDRARAFIVPVLYNYIYQFMGVFFLGRHTKKGH